MTAPLGDVQEALEAVLLVFCDQELGVLMLWPVEHLGGRAVLDDVALAHDQHLVADLRDDREVVRHDDLGESGALAQVGEQIENLCLHGHVHRGGRLVGDQHLGISGDGGRDEHPLQHAARQLIGVLAVDAFGLPELHRAEQVERPVPGLPSANLLLHPDDLGDLRSDGNRGVEIGRRILEDRADGGAA
jgi:hypothetical protein